MMSRDVVGVSLPIIDRSNPVSCSLCGVVPGLSGVLLPRMNPFVLMDVGGALALCITYLLIEIK